MNYEQIIALKQNDFILHKQLGLCIVDDFVIDFDTRKCVGIYVKPLTNIGMAILAKKVQIHVNFYLETDFEKILNSVDNPEIPLLLLCTEKGFYLYKWDILGQVDIKGFPSSTLVRKVQSVFEIFDILNDQIKLM